MRGVNEENKEAVEPSSEEKKERKRTLKVGAEVIRPYKGKEELPKETLDSKGNVIKPGEPRHFVARQMNNYKLIRVYRAKGIKHSLVRMVKPYTKPGDKIFFQQLKKLEIPGAI